MEILQTLHHCVSLINKFNMTKKIKLEYVSRSTGNSYIDIMIEDIEFGRVQYYKNKIVYVPYKITEIEAKSTVLDALEFAELITKAIEEIKKWDDKLDDKLESYIDLGQVKQI